MGCDSALDSTVKSIDMFQSTHPHGVRRNISPDDTCSWAFQSTHPHGVRQGWFLLRKVEQGVSIHAPTWGATIAILYQFFVIYVSIHAPTWGATQTALVHQRSTAVSIHAPTWGATLRFCT